MPVLNNLKAMIAALEKAGVVFTGDDDSPGVQLRPKKAKRSR